MTDGLITLSASKLKTFTACERKYYYEYIDRRESKKHPAAALGTAVHKTIERVYKEGTDPAPIFLAEFDKEIVQYEDVDVDLRKYRADGVKMVQLYKFDRRVPVEMELEFLLPFPNQAHPLCNIRGIIDQTYDWGFVDLKTNRSKPLHSVLDNDIQFILYDWAYNEIYNTPAVNRVWNHLRTGEDLYADTTGKLDNATRAIERILEKQVTGIYDRSIGDPCRICNFRLPCLGRED